MRLIDADALIDELGISDEDIIFEGMLVDAPTIDAVPRWIPCEERLPNDDEDVLISYCHKEGEGNTSHVYIDITSYGQMYFGVNRVGDYKHWRAPFEYFESNYEVIAWMPLPEPYKGERKNDDKSCDTCKHYDKGLDDIICDGCTKAHSNWERKDDE